MGLGLSLGRGIDLCTLHLDLQLGLSTEPLADAIYLPLIRHEQQPGIGLAIRKAILHRRRVIASPTLRPPGATLGPLDQQELDRMLSQSDLVIAQSYAPTDYDWRIGVLDGELENHRRLLPITRFARSQDLEVEVFTNGAGITEDVARELFESRVPVVLRMDSLDEEIQDLLTGTEGSFELIEQAFWRVREAGYPSS